MCTCRSVGGMQNTVMARQEMHRLAMYMLWGLRFLDRPGRETREEKIKLDAKWLETGLELTFNCLTNCVTLAKICLICYSANLAGRFNFSS